jgi:flagellar biosynthesis/type III secretory pathway protein FliH
MSKSILLSQAITGFVPAGTRMASAPQQPAVDVEKIRREANAQAQAAVRAEVDKHRSEQAEKCRRCGSQFDEFLDHMKVEIADQVISLAVKLTEVILRHEIPDRQMLFDVIRETLEPVSDLQGAKVRLHPADAASLLKARAESSAPMIVSDRVELVADSSLAPGDMMIESRNGTFDARLSQRLGLLEEKLLERRRRSHANER